MGDCSNGCGGCKPTSTCNDSCDKDSCDKDSCCDSCKGGTCDCDAKYAVAYNQAMQDNGMKCLLCNYFYQYALPNRCNGDLICFKCREEPAGFERINLDIRSWQIPKGRWKK